MSEEDNQVRHPPTRDVSTLKHVLYGPGHEKFPSWPIAAAAEAPIATRAPPTGTSQRSKSWIDHTNYPKENIVAYTRPYMRRSNQLQLKTVLERSEKNTQDQIDYLSRMDRVEKPFDKNNVPSPPVRDRNQYKNIQEYEKLLEDQSLLRYSYDMLSKENPSSFTQADLEEYTRTCEEINIQHQKQPSYAQSEGYHSYVSSTDSTSTPFLDRLRRDIDTTVLRGSSSSWDHDSIVTTSSGSASSSETLKWKGSLSDVSVASGSLNVSRQQLIAHSARVQTPQRHNSESVLYIENNRNDYPSNVARSHYAASNCSGSQLAEPQTNHLTLSQSPPSHQRTVAERIHQYEKQATKYTFLGPDKKTKVSDPALKAIQKKALLQFYERHQNQNKGSWKSEPKLNIKPKPLNMVEMDNFSDNINSQTKLKNISITENDANNSKSTRLSCDIKSHLKQSIDSNKTEQNKSYKTKFREVNHPSVKDQVDPEIRETVSPVHVSPHGRVSNINKNISESSAIKFDAYLRNSGNTSINISRDLNSHERSPSLDLSHYTPMKFSKVVSEPPITSEHQNSDLQGPIILGNSISVDDWVPERPPKNQELLRSVYPDLYKDKSRYHSPELPLPSPPPPLCEEETVCVNDEPFPPPPLEIIDEWKYQQEVLDIPPPRGVTHYRNSTPERQKPGNYAVKDTSFVEDFNGSRISITKSSPPPTKPKPTKREYPSNSKINVASRRNSFANAHDIAKDYPVLAANMRASVREKPNQFNSSKLVMSAQRQLYRSITVDQSTAIPKKPINPFLRSTSMKHDIPEHNKDLINHNVLPNIERSPVRLDQTTIPYFQQGSPKHLPNNAGLLPANNKKISGQFRAEPMWIPHKPDMEVKTRRESASQVTNGIVRPTGEVRRISLPSRPSKEIFPIHDTRKPDYNRNASFDGSELNHNAYSFCESDIENITAKTADVRSINLENIVKKPSIQWVKAVPPDNLRRQSASSGLQMEQEKGSPDVNTGSYKKINASCVEKNIDDTAPREEVQDIFLTSDIIKDLTECPEQQRVNEVETVINKNNHEYADIPKNTVDNRTHEIVEDNSQPDVVKPTDDHKEEVPLLAVPKSSTLQAEVSPNKDELKSISPLNGSTSIIQVERLKPRILLPEESLWEKLRPKLVICLQPESPLMTFISQYEECNSTSESITNIFEIDVPGRPTSKEDSLLEERTEANDAVKNNLPARTKETNQLIERLQDLKLDRNWDEVMSYACSCLHSLITALTDEGIQLEQAASVNEAVGVQLLATAPKSARLSRHAADVGRVTALIAGLATRLARATNPLKLAVHSPERRRMLMAKQEKLADQLEEAKKLKENIDSRGSSLFDSLSTQVSEEFKGQYSQFIATKVKLTVYARDVQDRLDLAKQLLDGFQLDNRLVNDSAVAKHVSLAAKEDGAVFK